MLDIADDIANRMCTQVMIAAIATRAWLWLNIFSQIGKLGFNLKSYPKIPCLCGLRVFLRCGGFSRAYRISKYYTDPKNKLKIENIRFL